mmetsp:Transcript_22423/g.34264  ORF Transcript_22423/g.34264 Transcript_22423/m.34264 type:complete len:255 (-) Transcript_22423:734-1498(-)|eukprot:CAMPEP_0118721542 /NCGR_PEP_ID=MMETSP0800-20121206/30792_1 /TAXON_ID=210618 ORGANISM="Striatella unipunctata, Strain CCMP2910" /NCGR_SAMPLE_ID=MMETSP0800 /ASSEMBLY_ACC=CAM_ASM_000638 /LENGTH=254 /DNA_ID=CAMNT_0006629441 /DNA_START=126 /DNA_END=890 /DNA_ORIENTATION=+
MGYNETEGSTSRIHIRLRKVQNHNSFVDWNYLVDTMAHELAHCVIHPHNDDFYALMDEILDEHASQIVGGNVLGGGKDSRRTTLLGQLAIERERRNAARQLGGTYKGRSNPLTPAQAAARAAEYRRRRERDDCCHPPRGGPGTYTTNNTQSSTSSSATTIVSPTNPTNGGTKWTCGQCTSINSRRYKGCRTCGSCSVCTFVNEMSATKCAMCGTDLDSKIVADLRKKQEMERNKKAEVQKSMNEFGFNIYGNSN